MCRFDFTKQWTFSLPSQCQQFHWNSLPNFYVGHHTLLMCWTLTSSAASVTDGRLNATERIEPEDCYRD